MPEFVVSGERRIVENELWESLDGPKPPMDFACNGCTASPDYVRGVRMWIPCVIHDWHYSPKSRILNKFKVEYKFWKNIYKTARYDEKGRLASAGLATSYAAVTSKIGWPFFKRG